MAVLILRHPAYHIIPRKMILEKIVKATPCKWDDILFDMIITPIFNNFASRKGMKNGTTKK